MFKGFKTYNWIIYLIGVGYVILALLDARDNIKKLVGKEEYEGQAFKEAMGYEECEGCQDAILHIVIPADKPDNVVNLEDYREAKGHEPA